ncbi:DUF1127 domain-containing protein [Roseitranquillus sediminis]|uniref:DUF1127 domain-containing protein n=1 Tax=Roseitranquillus sediminis TaxID=2809051 RepID=UPI001D0CD90D|nr:hypothetical protein [Roseitranquillus sediminis]MBM9594325.1 hypothetical protein [Roseitranquillus sediminis]
MNSQQVRRTILPALPNIRFAEFVMSIEAAWRERRAMREIDDAALRDMGLTRSDVENVRLEDILRR